MQERWREIEQPEMLVGLQFARRTVEQSVGSRPSRFRTTLLAEGDVVQSAGRERAPLETEAGPIAWDQPRSLLKPSCKALFP